MFAAAAHENFLTMSWRMLLAVMIGVTVFIADAFTTERGAPLKGAVSVLYIAVIVLVADRLNSRRLLAVGLICALAATFAYFKEHGREPPSEATVRFVVSLVAITMTTLLSIFNKVAASRQAEADARYRSIFDAGGFAVWEADWSGALAVMRELPAEASGDVEGWLRDNPDWIRRARQATRVRAMNDEALRLFGLAGPEAIVGKNFDAFYIGSMDARLAGVYAGLLRGERFVEIELTIRRASGELVEVMQRITRHDNDAPWACILSMAIDVTAHHDAQMKLDTALAELAHVSRVTTLGQLAASIVHEVNQPLSAVIAYGRSGLRWLAREAPEAHKTRDCLEGVVANAGHAADVIARVRDLARKTTPRAEPLELRTLIDETLVLLQREVQDRHIVVRRQVAPDTPVILGDRVQIQQVLMNLILNAAQALEQTASRREIVIAAARDDGMVNVSVRDNGGGFTGEASRLFEPFVTTTPQGLGVGLSICRSIVEGHGGKIRAANVGEGAEITFSLPAGVAAEGRVA
jgi:PAS domain S-box-containing protein